MRNYKNASGLDKVGDLLGGTSSIKTDVMVNVPPVTFLYLGVALFVGMVASQFVIKAIYK